MRRLLGGVLGVALLITAAPTVWGEAAARRGEEWVGVSAKQVRGRACTSAGELSPCIQFSISGGYWPATTDGVSKNWVAVSVMYPNPYAAGPEFVFLDEFDVSKTGGVRGKAIRPCSGEIDHFANYRAEDGSEPDPLTFESTMALPLPC